MQPIEDLNVEARNRPVVRSNSLKRRDASWDQKWSEHLERNTPEGDTLPRSSVFSRSPRQPGKVNRKLWEQRAAHDQVEK